MGFPVKQLTGSEFCDPKNALESYYKEMIKYLLEHSELGEKKTKRILGSIFTRLRLHTNTEDNRELSLVDIDKIFSLQIRCLDEKDERINAMRQQSEQFGYLQEENTTFRQITDLVRLARLHLFYHQTTRPYAILGIAPNPIRGIDSITSESEIE